MTEGYDAMFEAERLLAEAAQDWTKARAAALDAMRALLIEWGVTPRAETVVGLLDYNATLSGTVSPTGAVSMTSTAASGSTGSASTARASAAFRRSRNRT